MTAVYWVVGVVAYFAVAIWVMRWRTKRIDAGKPWSIFTAVKSPTKRERDSAHKFTTAIGILWPITVVVNALFDLLMLGLILGMLAVDWLMRKIARLPRQ